MSEFTPVAVTHTSKSKNRGAIRQRLVFIFVVLVLLPMLILAVVSGFLGANTGTDNRLNKLRIIADFKTVQVLNWFNRLQDDVRREAIYFENNQTDILRVSPDLPEFREAYIVQRTHLVEILEQYPEVDAFLLLNLQGRVLVSTDRAEEGNVYVDEVYFQASLQEPYVHSPQYFGVADLALVMVLHPIRDAEGNVLGVLGARVTAMGLGDIMTQSTVSVDEVVEMYLVDKQYNLLTPLNPESQSRYIPNIGVKSALEKQTALSGQYDNYANKPVLAVYQWVPELEAVLIVESPVGVAMSTLLSVVTIDVTITLLALGLAVLAGFLIVRDIVQPISALSETALRIVEGERVDITVLEREDEIGTLAQALDSMKQRLQEQIDSLEVRVAERTETLQRHTLELESASRITRQMTAVRDVDTLLSLGVQQIAEQFDFQHVGIFLLNDTLEFAQLRAASSKIGKDAALSAYKVAVGGDDLVGSVASLGQPRILHPESVSSERERVEHKRGAQRAIFHPRSQVALPLIVRDQVIGVMDIHSSKPDFFTYGNIAHLQTVAEQLSLALDNLRLLSATEAQLNEIQQLMRSQNQDDWVRLVQNRMQWGYVYDGTEVKPREELPIIQSPQLSIPIKGNNEIIGKLNVFDEHNPLSASDMELVETIAAQAGQALESARLFNKMQTALEEVGVLYRGSQALGAARTTDEVLRAFVDYLISSDIDRCVLALLEPQSHSVGGIVRIEAAWDAGKAHSPLIGDRWLVEKIPAMKETTQLPLAVSDVRDTSQLDEASMEVFRAVLRVRAFLIVPLTARETLLGWLLVASLRKPYTFSEREIRVYRSVADQAAIVLQSIRLIADATQRAERERRITDITAEIRRHTDVDAILQTSIRELGHTLRASDGLIRLGVGAERQIPKTQPLRPPAMQPQSMRTQSMRAQPVRPYSSEDKAS